MKIQQPWHPFLSDINNSKTKSLSANIENTVSVSIYSVYEFGMITVYRFS